MNCGILRIPFYNETMSSIENPMFREQMEKSKDEPSADVFGESEDAGEDWLENAMTVSEMVREFGIPHTRVNKYIKLVVDEYPDLAGKPAVKDGVRGLYYPKELVDFVKRFSQSEEEEMAPEGWLTLEEIMRKLPRSKSWVEERILSMKKRYYDENKREFLKKGVKRFHTHFSPDLISKLEKMAEDEEEKYDAPEEGEMTERGIIEELKRSREWVRSNISKLIRENPELGAIVGKKQGRAARGYYPKELVDRLREISAKEEFLPPGRPKRKRE